MAKTIVALLRGINVGGRNKLPMKELRSILSKLGHETVKTYIQSGNAVFRSDRSDLTEIGVEIGQAITQHFGFTPQVMVIGLDMLEQAVAQNPYPEAAEYPKTLHLYFLEKTATQPNLAQLTERQKESEHFSLIGRVFYLHAPEGIGRSKLAERVEKSLGVATTARNWRSVQKILDLAREITS